MDALARLAYAMPVVSPAYAGRQSTMIELGDMLRGDPKDRILPILYKTRHTDIVLKLPALADTLMKEWDESDPDPLLNEIARIVRDSRRGGRDPAAGLGSRHGTDRTGGRHGTGTAAAAGDRDPLRTGDECDKAADEATAEPAADGSKVSCLGGRTRPCAAPRRRQAALPPAEGGVRKARALACSSPVR